MELELLEEKHFQSLFEFEKSNRDWFEQFVPPRPSSYDSFASFRDITNSLIEQHEEGTGFFYVVVEDGEVIARANMIDVTDDECEIGYRVCQNWSGKGVASFAVKQLIEIASDELDLRLLTAKAATNNPASMRVLEKAEFVRVGQEKNAFVLNGKTLSLACYEKTLN
jgi:ribosomal-protein-alanine N-acetyltransferase